MTPNSYACLQLEHSSYLGSEGARFEVALRHWTDSTKEWVTVDSWSGDGSPSEQVMAEIIAVLEVYTALSPRTLFEEEPFPE